MISILCPTRNRPREAQRLMRSAMATAEGDIEFIFYCDNDAILPDIITSKEYVTTLVGKRITLSKMWNECQRRANYDIYMQCGDDIVFRTPGWDTRVIEAFSEHPDNIVFVHCNAMDWGAELGTHGFLHRKWVEAVGYFVPPYFVSDFNDKWLTEVAKMIGRHTYLEDVITEHLHPIWGKAPWDQTYIERLNRHGTSDPAALYESLAEQREQDAAKLRAVME
jgi:hypothetical protein